MPCSLPSYCFLHWWHPILVPQWKASILQTQHRIYLSFSKTVSSLKPVSSKYLNKYFWYTIPIIWRSKLFSLVVILCTFIFKGTYFFSYPKHRVFEPTESLLLKFKNWPTNLSIFVCLNSVSTFTSAARTSTTPGQRSRIVPLFRNRLIHQYSFPWKVLGNRCDRSHQWTNPQRDDRA